MYPCLHACTLVTCLCMYVCIYVCIYIYIYIYAHTYTQVWNQMVKVFQSVGLPKNYIGIHARYGDKRSEVMPQQVEGYFLAACLVSKTTGIKDVFLASDSQQFIHNFERMKAVNKSMFHGVECAADLRVYYNEGCVRLQGYDSQAMK